MSERVTLRRRGSYGIDAPYGSAFLAGLLLLYFVLAIVNGKLLFWLCGTFILSVETFHLYFTLRGKFVLWAELLDRLRLRGDEDILDLGCGRGAVSFDVVLSSLAIHNISSRAGREKAIGEAVRVLRPGGRMVIVDVRATGQHEVQLAKLGMNDVARRRLGWQFWPTRVVTATKPERGDRGGSAALHRLSADARQEGDEQDTEGRTAPI